MVAAGSPSPGAAPGCAACERGHTACGASSPDHAVNGPTGSDPAVVRVPIGRAARRGGGSHLSCWRRAATSTESAAVGELDPRRSAQAEPGQEMRGSGGLRPGEEESTLRAVVSGEGARTGMLGEVARYRQSGRVTRWQTAAQFRARPDAGTDRRPKQARPASRPNGAKHSLYWVSSKGRVRSSINSSTRTGVYRIGRCELHPTVALLNHRCRRACPYCSNWPSATLVRCEAPTFLSLLTYTWVGSGRARPGSGGQ
jgi:hypothetical protein